MKGNKIPLQSKSDLLRLLLLWKYGGAWIDTDTVLLRDIHPVIAWAGGDVGAKFAMTQKYNNAFLALRKRSKVATAMLELACKYPRGADFGGYCTVVGLPCHSDWWYNHGPQQWASQQPGKLQSLARACTVNQTSAQVPWADVINIV